MIFMKDGTIKSCCEWSGGLVNETSQKQPHVYMEHKSEVDVRIPKNRFNFCPNCGSVNGQEV
jgi:hypothetical protein